MLGDRNREEERHRSDTEIKKEKEIHRGREMEKIAMSERTEYLEYSKCLQHLCETNNTGMSKDY